MILKKLEIIIDPEELEIGLTRVNDPRCCDPGPIRPTGSAPAGQAIHTPLSWFTDK